jgi:MoaA/NifB/PqqE/SkfB family radical SAM enzyme
MANAVPFSSARYVSLRLQWACNLRCIMCDHPYRDPIEMAPAVAHAVLDALTHPVRLTFIGGEPCLWLRRHRDVLARALDSPHVVHLITNGTLLHDLPEFVEAFRTREISVQFSIDGMGATYESIRRGASWDLVVDAIRRVNAARRAGANRRAVITAGYLLMRQTLDDLPAFVRFCAREGIDALSLTYALVDQRMVARGVIADDDSVQCHRAATDAAVAEACAVARELGLPLAHPQPLTRSTPGGRRWIGQETATRAPGRSAIPPMPVACDKPWKELFVCHDGTIMPCCCGPSVGPTFGRVEQGLADSWNGAAAMRVRSALIERRFDPSCRCGANMTTVDRELTPVHFFTRLRDAERRAAHQEDRSWPIKSRSALDRP